MRLVFSLFLITIVLIKCKAEFNKLIWIDCGSPQVKFNEMSITPMPILNPGSASFNFNVDFNRATSGPLNTDLNLIRTVAGLALPIRW